MNALRPRAPRLLIVALLCLVAACAVRKPPVHDVIKTTAQTGDLLALSDALENLIASGHETPTDRQYAYEIASKNTEDTAASMFARAAITGRLVQQKGLLGATLVADIERCARRSRELDPNFRDGAATRLLGTLYVVAPASLLQHGDSETGLDLLEGLTVAHPETLENHLRLAEAYVALGDHAPAQPHLCRCLAAKHALRPDDQQLLAQLVADVGTLQCDGAAAAP